MHDQEANRKMNVNKILVLATVTILAYTGSADANKAGDLWQELKDIQWEDGRYRLELQGWTATRSGRRGRTGDYGTAGTIEREFVFGSKTSIGLRAIPLFFVREDDHDTFEDFDGDGLYEHRLYEGNDIVGAGVGIAIHHYFRDIQDGWYFEFYESFFAQSEKFQGNSGNFNFMSEIGIGYEFENDWHIAAKWRHMSNAGIADKNAGINSVGIGIGFSF